MKNKATTMNYFITYKDQRFEVDTTEDTRVTAFENGKPVYTTTTQFNIRKDGQLVGFVFDQTEVPTAVAQMVDFPNQAEAINCRFD